MVYPAMSAHLLFAGFLDPAVLSVQRSDDLCQEEKLIWLGVPYLLGVVGDVGVGDRRERKSVRTSEAREKIEGP